MRGFVLAALLVPTSLLLSGCATLVLGTHQALLVASEPEGALVELSDGRLGRTPEIFHVYRRSEIEVRVELEGHATRQTTVEHRESRYGGLLALGTFIVSFPLVPFNFLIFSADNFSPAIFELTPNPIDVELRPLDGAAWARLPEPHRSIPRSRTSCEDPYALERHCSFWSRARREVQIRGLHVRVSGSQDGKVIRVHPAQVDYARPRDSRATRRTRVRPSPQRASERPLVVRRRAAGAVESCERVHRHLALAGARLEELVGLTRGEHPDGCYLVYDRDAYALLPVE